MYSNNSEWFLTNHNKYNDLCLLHQPKHPPTYLCEILYLFPSWFWWYQDPDNKKFRVCEFCDVIWNYKNSFLLSSFSFCQLQTDLFSLRTYVFGTILYHPQTQLLQCQRYSSCSPKHQWTEMKTLKLLRTQKEMIHCVWVLHT